MDQADSILLFDGVCNLCNSVVNFVIRKDRSGKIRIASLQSSAAQDLLKNFNFAGDAIDSVVYLTEGKAFVRSTAVLHLLRDVGRGWNLFYGLVIIPSFIRDFIYDLVAKHRYRLFGKRESCMLPSVENKARFLE